MSDFSSNPVKIDITPTLVIGLGGTGMRVLSLFKQKIGLVCDPDAPVAFFGIDTTEERLPGAPLSTNEFALCECPAAPEIVERIDKHEDIKRWWIPDIKPGRIRRGAKMKRIVGRLACYYNYSSMIELPLRKHIAALTKQLKPRARRYEIRKETIRVYIVGSLSGGTGGGFFYDMAAAVRDTIEDVAGVNMNTCVAGIVIQPRGFVDIVPMPWQRQKVRANFFAGLREIENLHSNYEKMKDRDSNLAMWLGGKHIQLKGAPFEWIYLVDTINERGQNISVPQLWDMIASNLCLEVYSSITNQVEEGILANVTPLTPYASFAIASLRVPTRELLDYCSLRCAKEVLENKVSRARPEETTEIDDVARFFESTTLFEGGAEALSKSLADAAQGRCKTSVLETISRENAQQAVYVANDEWKDLDTGKKGLAAARKVVAAAAATKMGEVEQAAGRKIEEMLGDPNNAYGVEFLVQFARLLRNESMETCQELSQQAKGIDLATLEESIAPALAELRDTVNEQGNWIMSLFDRGRSAQHCYENWTGTVNTWAEACLKKWSLIEAAKVFQRLQEVANRLLGSLKNIAAQLDRAAKVCTRDAQAVASSLAESTAQHVLVTNVVGPAEFPQIYYKIREQVDLHQFVLMIKPKPDRSMDWVNVQIEDLEGTLWKELLPAITEELQPVIRKLDVFTAADTYWSGSVKQWVKDALAMCSPFCNWNPALVPEKVYSSTHLGVEDAARQKELLGEIDETKVALASTGDPHEIVIHALTAGYPASSVTGLGEDGEDRFYYELYCKKAQKDPNEHVHVDKRWLDESGAPLLPQIE